MTTPLTVADVLDRLAAWASDRKRCTRGVFARDARGREVGPDSPYACRWCVEGKLKALTAGNSHLYGDVFELLRGASEDLGYHNHLDANDHGGLVAVRAMIARAREEASGGDGG